MKKWIARLCFIGGFLLLCYPLVSGYMQQRYHQRAVATYSSNVKESSKEEKEQILKNARDYNNMLYQSKGAVVDDMNLGILSDESYNSQLKQSSQGIMGSIEIPKINVDLPIYHGTSDEVLSNGVGHQEGTSLPIGGENSHCVLTGHRGLPGSKLFTRLDEMEKGDLFFLNILGDTLAYKVDKIEVVEPDDVEVMNIQAEKDIVSLVTCTPFGLNTHRLVVTGERVPYEKGEYEGIKQSIPSGRELLFTTLPFILLAGACISKFREWRLKKREEEK